MERTLTFENYLFKVFLRVAIGLVISAVTAFFFIYSLFYNSFVANNFSLIMLISCFAELAVAIYFSAKLKKMSKNAAWTCYIVYAVLTGISLSSVLLSYGGATCFLAFGYTAIMFICMAFIGKTTKINLMGLTGLFSTGLISSIIISLINSLFIHSSGLDLFVVYLGVFIFLGLIAYDTRKLQTYFEYGSYSNEERDKIAIYGAFDLYLDFINLFLKLLSLLSRGKKNRD